MSAASPVIYSKLNRSTGYRSGLFAPKSVSLGAGVSTKGIKSLSKASPYERIVAVYNPETTYGRSFNLDYGQASKAKLVEKLMQTVSPHNFPKPRSTPKRRVRKALIEIADGIASEVSTSTKRLSPYHQNKLISLRPEQFAINKSPLFRHTSCKVLKSTVTNEEWYRQQSRERRQQTFLKGEFVPSVRQLELYGRREQPSR
jgi:hypothetical protein